MFPFPELSSIGEIPYPMIMKKMMERVVVDRD